MSHDVGRVCLTYGMTWTAIDDRVNAVAATAKAPLAATPNPK